MFRHRAGCHVGALRPAGQAFTDNPQVFVLRDRRKGDRALDAVGVFAVGWGDLDPILRRSVEATLRGLGVVSR